VFADPEVLHQGQVTVPEHWPRNVRHPTRPQPVGGRSGEASGIDVLVGLHARNPRPRVASYQRLQGHVRGPDGVNVIVVDCASARARPIVPAVVHVQIYSAIVLRQVRSTLETGDARNLPAVHCPSDERIGAFRLRHVEDVGEVQHVLPVVRQDPVVIVHAVAGKSAA
jgi:hypothetical protein